MKNIQTLLIIFIAIVLFTACQKDETPEVFDSISGVLTAGENISASDFGEIGIILAKLEDGIAPAAVTTKTEGVEVLKIIYANADGSFTFENLENGNYLLALSEDFTFANEDFEIASIDGKTLNKINQTVNRIADENKPKEYEWKIINYTDYSVSEILFYENGELVQTITPSQINNNTFSITLDRRKNVTLVVKCLNGENLIISDPGDIFGIVAASNIFTETEHGDLTVYNYWLFGRKIKLFDYCYDCYWF